jgi:hypothetical protein
VDWQLLLAHPLENHFSLFLGFFSPLLEDQ